CGAFISLFVEADPLIAALAVLIIALNAGLMLAYLPAHRGVLQGGHLADGEGAEAGENYERLGADRVADAPAAACVPAAPVLVAAVACYGFVVPFADGPTGLVTLGVPAVRLGVG